jgi:hypothetical protein
MANNQVHKTFKKVLRKLDLGQPTVLKDPYEGMTEAQRAMAKRVDAEKTLAFKYVKQHSSFELIKAMIREDHENIDIIKWLAYRKELDGCSQETMEKALRFYKRHYREEYKTPDKERPNLSHLIDSDLPEVKLRKEVSTLIRTQSERIGGMLARERQFDIPMPTTVKEIEAYTDILELAGKLHGLIGGAGQAASPTGVISNISAKEIEENIQDITKTRIESDEMADLLTKLTNMKNPESLEHTVSVNG